MPNGAASNTNAVNLKNCRALQGLVKNAAVGNVLSRTIGTRHVAPSLRQRPVRRAAAWFGDYDDDVSHLFSTLIELRPAQCPAQLLAATAGHASTPPVQKDKHGNNAPVTESSADDEELLEGFYPTAYLVETGHRASSSIVFMQKKEDSFSGSNAAHCAGSVADRVVPA
ncbi:hypothetical protein TraAM80_01299 [Trypanosoma rangeli]|uniref:Uncharacterized protein n=1 Tax=Trypanosoma rangeli TaxID=5698 RepID=A0A422NZ53_TRYRA|nr:uncharacterized protein TraAM80_01299 [Trypanosoma rangeli]RNF10738.1 hypothetical protein TraAM80_01299 [Trypanosoma rangeli]|eukprot:RNF10738.1 hypothetical protein TraAM80_01299 [Trypanosoma rangeli]